MALLQEHIRQNIIGILNDFASPEKQRAYQESVPNIDILAELICMWGDDLYHPDTKEFHLAFDAAEEQVLEDFDREFNLLVGSLPKDSMTLDQVIASDAWVRLIKAATNALARLSALNS